ncbi:MAG: VWA domain-containing protein [Methylococcaceae bacterium]|nr:VWA domain-containing protein [Methylococcaceae bacterium]
MKHLKPQSLHGLKNKHIAGIVAILGAAILLMFSSSAAQAANDPIQLTGKLSQTTFVQGGANTVYLDIIIKAPKQVAEQNKVARATDMMIVLDRSGSMGGAKKMTFAKAAIRDILARLNNQDRFALVSFANDGITHSPFVSVNAGDRENLNSIVDNINASGGTNMGDGLQAALRLSSANSSERVKKVLLLSDGKANQGISSTQGLSEMVTQITQTGAVLSAIGMGLDFNEVLLTTLADYGMGHYSYLEDLAGLGKVLEKDLSDTRTIFANGSTLDINLGKGVSVIDAGGYPVTTINPTTIRITTGQILDNTDKHFVITFNIPAKDVGSVSLGDMRLNYQSKNSQYETPLTDTILELSIVEATRRDEALKSVNESVYKQTWTENNLGRMKKVLSKSVREGDKDKAQQAIIDYKQAVEKAEKESNVKIINSEMEEELKTMQDEVDDAFVGSASMQEIKQKRSSKSIQQDSIQQQRK